MKLTEVLPTVIVVTDSMEFFNDYQKIIKAELPDLLCMCVSSADAQKSFHQFRPDKYKKEGFDIWIPRKSCVNLGRSFRRKLKPLIR